MIKIGDTVEFEFDPGKLRDGRVVDILKEPGWTFRQLQIRYRGSLSWRSESKVKKVD